MKIVYLCNEVNLKSGWAVLNYHTIKQAIENGHQVTVFTQRNANNILLPNVHYIPILFKIGQLSVFYEILTLIRLILFSLNNRFDVCHVLVEPYLIYGPIFFRSHLFLSAVGTYAVSIFKNGKLKSIYRLALKQVKVIFPISDYTDKWFRNNVSKFSKLNTKVCTLGVDFTHFTASEFYSTKNKKIAFCLIGQIKKRKGVHLAIEAIQILKRQNPLIELIIVGDNKNSYATDCMKIVTDNHLEKNIYFLGPVSDENLLDIYSQCIGNILPSINTDDGHFEGFGLIHLEANAMGLPSIGSLDTGNESAIKDNVSGYLVKQNDAQDLASKMQHLINLYTTGHLPQLSLRCVEHAKENSWQNYFAKIEASYFLRTDLEK